MDGLTLSVAPQGYVWSNGDAERKNPFPGHEALDGVEEVPAERAIVCSM